MAQPTVVNIGKTGYAVTVAVDGTDLVLGGSTYVLTQAGEFVRREPDGTGVIESEVFPGLRLNVDAALALDRRRVLAIVGTEGGQGA